MQGGVNVLSRNASRYCGKVYGKALAIMDNPSHARIGCAAPYFGCP
jgi:hypothetical protein